MLNSKRIETREAKALRSRRQRFAAPGGSHDRLVGVLARLLPMAVGVLAALMVITPLSPRGEIGFLLDRNKVAMIDERLRVDNAMYRGEDDRGRPFSVIAGEAVQRSSREGLLRLRELVARILLNEGPAQLTAEAGTYDIEEETVAVDGPVLLTAADGYRMMARGVTVDLEERRMTGSEGVEGTIPAGTFSANRMVADLGARTFTLDGRARLQMIPGELRMPQ